MYRVLVILMTLLIAGLSCLGLWLSSNHLAVIQPRDYKVVSLPPLADFDENLVNIISFGHKGVLEALWSIWVTQIFNDPKLSPDHASQIVDLVEELSRHKPRLEKTLFISSCVMLLQKCGRPDLCFKVTELGIEVLPDSWMIPLTQGFVEGSILKNRERSAFFYFLASQKEDVPEYVRSVALKLAKETGDLTEQEYLDTFNKMLNLPGGERFLGFLKEALAGEKNNE